jgi:hypothetical protein
VASETWSDAVDALRPYMFRISTPRGFGTGFLISRHQDQQLCAIATAAHVVNHAHYWEEPIRLEHLASGRNVLVRMPQRVMFLDEAHDTAALLMNVGDLELPSNNLPLGPKGHHFRVGNDIGWVGFPAVASTALCFFRGRVSAWLGEEQSYLIDGVAINGVSGGPAFHLAKDLPFIIGVVSAYVPNRATGETLPGLAVIRDVTQFHNLAPTFATLDEAKSQETPPTVPPPPPDIEQENAGVTRRSL